MEHILIVDDTPSNLDILTNALSQYRLSLALNGESALKIASEVVLPDLILLDIMMPEMDGYEVCRRLKLDERTKDIRVIFLTAKTDTESILKGFKAGGVDYVTKPFNIEELLARVTTQLALKKSMNDVERYLAELKLKNKLINYSIKYAQSLQNAVLPDIEKIEEILGDCFLLFKPKDIVSGDFYWIRKIRNLIVVVVGDCTGHGVPGALMSMMGISFLNETFNKSRPGMANEILERLRKMIKKSLNQTGGKSEQKDGMDMALCIIDKDAMQLQFAGAYSSLYRIRNNELVVFQGDKQPIAVHAVEKTFSKFDIDLKKGDLFYMFSDGFSDQFGGSENRKYMTKNFKLFLHEIHNNPLAEQRTKLDEEFEKWRGENDQVDDVVVMGFRI